MQVLVTYHYEAPEGTTPEGEEPLQVINSGVFPTIEKALDWVHDQFDGYETFQDARQEITEALEEEGNYYFDDYSAGQWITFTAVKNGTAIHTV